MGKGSLMAKTQIDKDMDAIFASDVKTGKLALVTMAKLVTDLAATRNSDPMRRFISKARNHHHNNFSVVMTKLIRVYFGDKKVVAAKDENHPTGTSIKLKFDGNPGPSNGWGIVTSAIEKGVAYNDRAFVKKLTEALTPEKSALEYEAQVVKLDTRLDNLIKWMEKEASLLNPSLVSSHLAQKLKDYRASTPVNDEETAEVVDIEDAILVA